MVVNSLVIKILCLCLHRQQSYQLFLFIFVDVIVVVVFYVVVVVFLLLLSLFEKCYFLWIMYCFSCLAFIKAEPETEWRREPLLSVLWYKFRVKNKDSTIVIKLIYTQPSYHYLTMSPTLNSTCVVSAFPSATLGGLEVSKGEKLVKNCFFTG